ncbi:MAG: hypothetical protein MN733_26890, partial [Nitrososphaera sp.]|nr:hypothetical protein [Nitrososphaera sp.]
MSDQKENINNTEEKPNTTTTAHTKKNSRQVPSQAIQSMIPAVRVPPTLPTLFRLPVGDVDLSKAKRLSLPRLFLPDDLPVGAELEFVVVNATPSPDKRVKQKCIWCRH